MKTIKHKNFACAFNEEMRKYLEIEEFFSHKKANIGKINRRNTEKILEKFHKIKLKTIKEEIKK